MDALLHPASKNSATSPSHAPPPRSPTPPSPPPPTNTMATTTPEPTTHLSKLRGARTSFMSDDFPTATELAYELLEDSSVPFWILAQAALIVMNYDQHPGSKPAYAHAMGIVEKITAMDQESVEPGYKSLQQKIEGKRISTSSSEGAVPLKMEQSQIKGEIAGRGVSAVDEQEARTAVQNQDQGTLDRDIGMKLRQQDRAQLDGGEDDKEGEGDGKQAEDDVREMGGQGDEETVKSGMSHRECRCICVIT